MKRWWWVGTLILLNVSAGCRSKLPERSADGQALDRAIVALAVGHHRNMFFRTPVTEPDNRDLDNEEKQDPQTPSPKPVVTVYLQKGEGCLPCHAFQSWWGTLSEEERVKLPCTFRLQQEAIPDWVVAFPTFHWADVEKKSWFCNGWDGIGSFLARFRGTMHETQAASDAMEQRHNLMSPAGSDRSLNAGDWTEWMAELLRSGEIPLNSQYSLWVPAAESLRWSRSATQGELRFDAPYPLLRLNWHGLRYDDTVRKLAVTPGKISVTLGTFGELAFVVQSP